MIEGQPFNGQLLGDGIYFQLCDGFYPHLKLVSGRRSESCPNCGSDTIYLTRFDGDYQIYQYCISCGFTYSGHQLTCSCGSQKFKEWKGKIRCVCGLEADTVQDMLYELL